MASTWFQVLLLWKIQREGKKGHRDNEIAALGQNLVFFFKKSKHKNLARKKKKKNRTANKKLRLKIWPAGSLLSPADAVSKETW